MPAPKAKEYEFRVDGELVDMDDMTFQEQQLYRQTIRESSGDPTLNPLFAEPMDKWPALIFIVRRRSNESYTYEEATEVPLKEVLVEVKRPTRAGKKATPAT